MLGFAAALNLPDGQVVRRVRDDHRRGFGVHQPPNILGGLGIAAQESVRAKLP
jgi:hypothetical protein